MNEQNTDPSSIDRITEDGILCKIISPLRLKEAVRTCVLSRRWRYIWTYLPHLDFHPSNVLDDDDYSFLTFDINPQKFAIQRDKFITSVNSVLRQHQCVGVERLRVNFCLAKIPTHHLDAWVFFGLASKTKTLVLDLCPLYLTSEEQYDFPCQLLGASSVESLTLMSCSLKPPHGFDGLRRLKNLHLVDVDVTLEDVRHLLSNCCALEDLTLDGSEQLVTLSISNPLSQLKNLTVEDCDGLKKIELDAINLTMLSYEGDPVDFLFRNSSKLTRARVGFSPINVDVPINILPDSLPNLEYLSFEICDYSQVITNLKRNSSLFVCLRQLEWTITSSLQNKMDHWSLASVLNVAPLLEKFSICYRTLDKNPKEVRKMKRMQPSPHTHLKDVKFKGFAGDKRQIIFAVYILNSATELESMTIEKHENCLEANMEYLLPEVPANSTLVIL